MRIYVLYIVLILLFSRMMTQYNALPEPNPLASCLWSPHTESACYSLTGSPSSSPHAWPTADPMTSGGETERQRDRDGERDNERARRKESENEIGENDEGCEIQTARDTEGQRERQSMRVC